MSAILLLLVPGVSLFFLVTRGVRFPFDEARFLLEALLICLASYAAVCLVAFWGTFRQRDTVLATIFLFSLWVITGIPGLAMLNQQLDSGAAEKKMSKVVATRELSGSAHPRPSRGSCLLTFSEKIEDLDQKSIRRDTCGILRPKIDGIEFRLRPGALGWKWAEDYSLIQDYDLYRQRLGL